MGPIAKSRVIPISIKVIFRLKQKLIAPKRGWPRFLPYFCSMKNERPFLLTLALVQFAHIMDFMILMPLGPQLMRLFQINPQEFGLLVSSYTITAGVFGFLGAFVIDRFDRKQALLFIFGTFTLGTLACAFAPSYYVLLITRSLTGASGGMLGAIIMSIVADVIPIDRRASAMGIVTSGFSAASVFGVPFGLFLATHLGWQAPFLFLGLAGAAVAVAIWLFIPPVNQHLHTNQPRATPREMVTNVANNPDQVRALLFMMVLMFGNFTVIPFISPYLVANVGFPETMLTYVYLIGGGLTIFASPLIGKFADRYGHQKTFQFFMWLYFIPILAITNMPPLPVVAVLVISSLFFIFGSGRMVPAMTMITATVTPATRGSFMSLNSSVQQLSTGAASLVGGLIIAKNQAGQLTNYAYVGVIAVCSSLVAIWLSCRLVAKA
jgi:MFS transporter, DHA1 family, inner membrane transport protein